MLPVFFDSGILKIYTFGVFLVLGFFWGCFLLWKIIRLTSYKEDEIFDSLFMGLSVALIIGRLTYVTLNFKEFGPDLIRVILINGFPGFSLIGSLIGGVLYILVYCYWKKIKFNDFIDYFIPPFFLGLGFGKVGSFFSGSEVGTPTKFILSVKYATFDRPRHLTPLYEAVLFFFLAFLTYRVLFAIRREKYQKGFNFLIGVWFFSLIYFIFDKIKGYHLYFMGRSFNLLLSAILLLTFSFYFLYYFRSLLFSRLERFNNLFLSYGKKTFEKIRHRTKGKARE